jgi:phosphinothricin acetyltransferase
MRFVDCSFERHAPQVLAILNEIILNSTAIYDYAPRSEASMGPWFAAKTAANHPVIGAEDESGQLLGYATYGPFRAWPAYKYTVELSLHLRVDARGRGLGPQLLSKLIETACARDVHVMMAGIDGTNASSIAVHERLGFVHAGTVRECGFKFGRYLDLALYQLILPSPSNPVDG